MTISREDTPVAGEPKRILITGATSGVGRATALALARQGHRLVLLCRNESLAEELCRAIEALPGAPRATLLIADLADPARVREAAERFLGIDRALHVLINNAGLVDTRRVLVDVEGSEQERMFAVNHLGHFLLTTLLLPRLAETARRSGEPSRVVTVSSEAYALFTRGIDFDDLSRAKGFGWTRAYGQSKLANILMTREFARRVDPAEVTFNALHPGGVKSNLGRDIEPSWYSSLLRAAVNPFLVSPERGAETSVFLATGDVKGNGEYFARCRPKRLRPWGRDEAAAARLWQVSREILKLD